MFKSKKTLFIFILVLGVFVGLAFLAKPVYGKIKDIRATSLANEAYESYLADPTGSQNLTEILRQAKSALFLSPTNYAANRTLATLSMFSQPAVSLQYWEQSRLLGNGKEGISFEDTMHYVQALLVARELEKASEVLIALEGDEKARAEIDYNLAKIRLLQGKRSESLEYARKMIRNRFTPIYQHLFFVGVCLGSEDEKVHAEGERHLKILFENEDLVDDSILWDMTQFRNLSPEMSALLKEKLYTKITDFDDRIALAEYQVTNDLNDPAAAFEQLLIDLDRRDELAVIHLAQWASKYELSEQALSLLDPDIALRRKDWFLLYVKNLGRNNEWDAVIDLLNREGCPIEVFWSYVLKAEAYFEMDQRAKAINAWYRAKLESRPTREDLWLLVQIGDRFELEDDTEDMLDELVILGETPEFVLGYIAKRDLGKKNYEGFYQRLDHFKNTYLGYPEILNDWAYYSILMDRNTEQALTTISRMVDEFPDQLRFHMTWAMAQIKEGKHREVLGRLQQFDLDWKTLHPKWRFVLSLALAGVGEFEQALEYFPETEKVLLNPHELELYEKLFYNR